jgi:hypothetical protein
MSETLQNLVERCRKSGGATIRVTDSEQRAIIHAAEKLQRMTDGAARGGKKPKGSEHGRKAARARWDREKIPAEVNRLRSMKRWMLDAELAKLRKKELKLIAFAIGVFTMDGDGEPYTRDQLQALVHKAISRQEKL